MNWVFATNSDFQIPISLQTDSFNLRYFKLRFDLTEFELFKVGNLDYNDICRYKIIRVLDKLNSFPCKPLYFIREPPLSSETHFIGDHLNFISDSQTFILVWCFIGNPLDFAIFQVGGVNKKVFNKNIHVCELR